MNPVQLGGEVTLTYTQLISLDNVTVDVLPEKKVCGQTLNVLQLF